MAAVEDEHPTSSTSTFSKEEVNKLISQGKRHFVCDEIVDAVKCFEEACLMLNKKYGVLSNECGDVNFQYGKSLFELARLESGVLGSALKEAVEEEIESAASDDENNMDTDKQGSSGGASAENTTTNNKESPDDHVKITAKGDAVGKEETNEEEPANVKAEGGTEERMDEDRTESSIVQDKPADDNKDNIKEKPKTGEEKPENEGTGESTEASMVENQTEEKRMKDKSTDDNKNNIKEGEEAITGEQRSVDEETGESTIKEGKQYKDNKDVFEDKDKSNKEYTSEEQKEVDESEADGKEDGTKGNIKKQENESKTNAKEKDGAVEQKDTDKKDEDLDDDEKTDDSPISTIQLAWESLELARIIFKRHTNAEMQLKLAQTHLLLGEINMEQEQFTDAVSELTKCLNIQKNLLKPDDRLLAETYHYLGLAYTLSMQYEESATHYGNAAEVLELRLKNIKERIEEAEKDDKGKGKASDDDPLVKDKKELAELEELLPEIKDKCLDAKNEGERLKSNIKEKLGLTSLGVDNTSFTCTSSFSGQTPTQDKPANDISHLVRKQKRKSEDNESPEISEAPAKKPRQDDNNTATQAENGDSTMTEATADVENLA